ncbi:MAG: thiamine-phosphate kinase [Aquificaceae bacterium]|nr:MAG: thiamine-phosphate kinase [Aquificaceae bacterium]
MERKENRLGEFELIELLTGEIKNSDPSILRDFGDDTAFVRYGESIFLLTVDTLVEGVHFLRRYPPSAIGWKLVSVNVSDIASKGGKPLWGLITLSLPPRMEVEYLRQLYGGINSALKHYGFSLVGGNTTKGDKLCLDFSLIGVARRVIYRDTPKVGDKIYVSGTLGDTKAGLELLLENRESYTSWERRLIEKHLKPQARLDLAPVVEKFATASMDISDGFLADLKKMVKNYTAVVYTDKLPLSEELKVFCHQRGCNPVLYALEGGEDYQLLVCSDKDLTPYGFTLVGQITAEGKGEIYTPDGRELKAKGFDHLKS